MGQENKENIKRRTFGEGMKCQSKEAEEAELCSDGTGHDEAKRTRRFVEEEK